MGIIISQDGGADMDIQSRLNRDVSMSMKIVLQLTQYSTCMKLRMYQSCILTTRLYGSGCRRIIEQNVSRLSSFHSTNLQIILMIFWPRRISNEHIRKSRNHVNRRHKKTVEVIGHVFRKGDTKTAVRWTHEG